MKIHNEKKPSRYEKAFLCLLGFNLHLLISSRNIQTGFHLYIFDPLTVTVIGLITDLKRLKVPPMLEDLFHFNNASSFAFVFGP